MKFWFLFGSDTALATLYFQPGAKRSLLLRNALYSTPPCQRSNAYSLYPRGRGSPLRLNIVPPLTFYRSLFCFFARRRMDCVLINILQIATFQTSFLPT